MAVVHTERGPIWYANHRRDYFPHPPLLLIHGAAGTHLDWPPDLRRINAVVPDLPGHGKSSDLPSRDRIPDYAADMIALLDTLEIALSVIVGHSMGGAVALTMALESPERVAGLILVSTGAKLAVSSMILDNVLPDQALVGKHLKTMLWSDGTPQQVRELGYEQFMRMPPQVALDDYTACQHFDIRDQLSRIQCPVLVFGASADQMTPPRYATYLAEHLPDTSLVMMENAGHMLPLEQPQHTADKIRHWLASRFGDNTVSGSSPIENI